MMMNVLPFFVLDQETMYKETKKKPEVIFTGMKMIKKMLVKDFIMSVDPGLKCVFNVGPDVRVSVCTDVFFPLKDCRIPLCKCASQWRE